jgi:thiamine pyrophosphate-dependent acetolactate synthase large subunit-like protein
VALAQPSRSVVVFDGDGNVLMGLGAVASVAAAGLPNLFHIVFDNGAHASTGGQRTIADRVPLEEIAGAAGYRRTTRVRDPQDLETEIGTMISGPGPSMLLVKVEAGNQAGIGRVELEPFVFSAGFRAACRRGDEA